jgi:hypothetical protein
MCKLDRADYLNTSELKKRGWTHVAIERFLPEPERTVINPYHRSGPPIRHWLRSTVDAVERTEEFPQWRAGSVHRKETAAKAVQTKLEQLLNYVDSLTVRLPIMDEKVLNSKATQSAQQEAAIRGYDGSPSPERAAVNYLRHECSNYEYELQQIAGKCGISEAMALLRGKIYAAIAASYHILTLRTNAKCRLNSGVQTSNSILLYLSWTWQRRPNRPCGLAVKKGNLTHRQAVEYPVQSRNTSFSFG